MFENMFGNMFGNKNEKSKNALIDKARKLKEDYDTPGNIAEKLEDFVNQLQSQEKTKSKKVAELDDELDVILDDIKAACKNGNTDEAESLCDALFTRANLRPAITKKKSSKNIYKPEEILNNMIARLNGRTDKLFQEQASISEKITRNPGNLVLYAKLQTVNAEIVSVQNQSKMLLDQNNRNAIMKGINGMTETEKIILADRDASDENFQLALGKFNDVMARMQERGEITKNGGDAYYGSTFGSTTAATPGVQPINYAAQAGVVGGSNPVRVNYAAAAGLSGFEQSGRAGASDGKDTNIENIFATLDKTIEELTLVDKFLSLKIKDANALIEEKKEILHELLNKRETASAIECIALDGDIDHLFNEISSAENDIENYANARALNDERLKLARRAKTERDIKSAGQVISDRTVLDATSASELAMFLKNATERRNDELDEAGAANAVADSAHAKTTSVSGGRAYGDSTLRTKDENKYNDARKKYGI